MKKNIQKTIAVLGAAVLATGMVGCGSSNTNTSAADTSADSSAAESGAAADTTENSADTKDKWFYHPGRFHFGGKICKCTGRNVHGEISERDRTG